MSGCNAFTVYPKYACVKGELYERKGGEYDKYGERYPNGKSSVYVAVTDGYGFEKKPVKCLDADRY